LSTVTDKAADAAPCTTGFFSHLHTGGYKM
jgi:hypothetical protein